MNCTKKIQIDGIIYTANTDFRVAIECNRIANDETIDEVERALGIICRVFGEKGYNSPYHYEKLLKWIKKWLLCGKEKKETNEKPDMDYIEDYDYIVASFQSDYNINLDEEKMDWYRFSSLMNGLSNNQDGNCCVLNRVRNLRNLDTSKIKDKKEKDRIERAKKEVALHKNKIVQEKQYTDEEIKNMEEFHKQMGL